MEVVASIVSFSFVGEMSFWPGNMEDGNACWAPRDWAMDPRYEHVLEDESSFLRAELVEDDVE